MCCGSLSAQSPLCMLMPVLFCYHSGVRRPGARGDEDSGAAQAGQAPGARPCLAAASNIRLSTATGRVSVLNISSARAWIVSRIDGRQSLSGYFGQPQDWHRQEG